MKSVKNKDLIFHISLVEIFVLVSFFLLFGLSGTLYNYYKEKDELNKQIALNNEKDDKIIEMLADKKYYDKKVASLYQLEEEKSKLIGKVDFLENENRKLKTKIEYLEDKNKGRDSPSCIKSESLIYLLFLEIHEEGILIKKKEDNQHNDKDWGGIFKKLNEGMYNTKDFKEEVNEMYKWSVSNNCRFFVEVRDFTKSKKSYRDKMKAIERHFYKMMRD